mmetsp:Transcript_14019/g.52394  ORF Transcript_14019/g.52394 Transcript_14019/m.52394 type:complete len:222 (+) Transcript_14019:1373-2038(+)
MLEEFMLSECSNQLSSSNSPSILATEEVAAMSTSPNQPKSSWSTHSFPASAPDFPEKVIGLGQRLLQDAEASFVCAIDSHSSCGKENGSPKSRMSHSKEPSPLLPVDDADRRLPAFFTDAAGDVVAWALPALRPPFLREDAGTAAERPLRAFAAAACFGSDSSTISMLALLTFLLPFTFPLLLDAFREVGLAFGSGTPARVLAVRMAARMPNSCKHSAWLA